MNKINIRRLDVSVLLVFHELIQCRRTTRVAERIGVSQSAISHALKRLREVFGDPLFTRRADGMEPTARALEIAVEIATVLDTLADLVHTPSRFDPGKSKRLFRISANDLVGALLAGPLVADLKMHAPSARLRFRFAVGVDSLDMLRRDDIDLAIGFVGSLPDGFVAVPLIEEGFSVVARRDHPRVKRTLALPRYLELDHLLVSFRGGMSGTIDRALERRSLERRVVASVPMFLTAFATVATSDVIATVPTRLAKLYAEGFGLRILRVPMEIEPFPIFAVRHDRSMRDTGIDWLLDRVQSILK
jgi:LysR family transcriptional regulator, mexEF-oprN operon transcriptional activator